MPSGELSMILPKVVKKANMCVKTAFVEVMKLIAPDEYRVETRHEEGFRAVKYHIVAEARKEGGSSGT